MVNDLFLQFLSQGSSPDSGFVTFLVSTVLETIFQEDWEPVAWAWKALPRCSWELWESLSCQPSAGVYVLSENLVGQQTTWPVSQDSHTKTLSEVLVPNSGGPGMYTADRQRWIIAPSPVLYVTKEPGWGCEPQSWVLAV